MVDEIEKKQEKRLCCLCRAQQSFESLLVCEQCFDENRPKVNSSKLFWINVSIAFFSFFLYLFGTWWLFFFSENWTKVYEKATRKHYYLNGNKIVRKSDYDCVAEEEIVVGKIRSLWKTDFSKEDKLFFFVVALFRPEWVVTIGSAILLFNYLYLSSIKEKQKVWDIKYLSRKS